MSLSSILLIEKNRLTSPNPWLLTLDVTLTDSTHLYLVRNTEAIPFNGQSYTPFPFELGELKWDTQGALVTTTLRVSNVTRMLQAYIEQLDGAVGSTVLARWINAAYLAENYADLELTFEVLETACDAQWITFQLGAPNLLRADWPQQQYLASHCNWVKQFKGAECKYPGADTSCDGTLDACRAKSNAINYGGFTGLSGGGVRLV